MASTRFPLISSVLALSVSLGCSSPATVPEEDALASDPLTSARAATSIEGAASSKRKLLVSEPGWGSYFPLEDGRSWHYLGTLSGWFTPTGGQPEPLFPEPYRYTLDWEIDGTVVLEGEEYAVVHETFRDASSEWQFCLYFRQTRDGLYERTDPCAAARDVAAGAGRAVRQAGIRPGLDLGVADVRLLAALQTLQSKLDRIRPHGAPNVMDSRTKQAEEPLPTLRRLAYPLRPNQEWLVVEYDPEAVFWSRVEGRSNITVSGGSQAAWKIRLLSTFLTPADEAYTYFSRDGYHGYEAHLFAEATNELGEPIGEVEYFEALREIGESAGGFQ